MKRKHPRCCDRRTAAYRFIASVLFVAAAAHADVPSKLTLVGKEKFLPAPRAGTRVCACAFYTRRTGVDMMSRHAYATRSDTADVAFRRFSKDNGKTWSDPVEVQTNKRVEAGTLRRFQYPGFVDPETGTLITFILQGILPTDNPLEGMKHWTLRYALSRDGGHTVCHEAQVIQAGDEFSAEHPLPGVRVGKNAVMIGDTTCTPIRLRTGEILQPVQITPIGPDGEYYNPGGGYTYHDAAVLIGRWNQSQTVDWTLSARVKADPARSTRGMFEPTVAQMPDDRILMVLRGSNDRKPDLPGYRWYAVSADRGRTWSIPQPWTYTDGKPFFSPSSCSQLLRHSNGRIYWIGNISPNNTRGNHPRYPLVIGEVDRKSFKLLKQTICTIDDRGPGDPAALQISNFYAYEDRQSYHIVVHCSPFPRPHPLSASKPKKGLDWTSDAFVYRIEAAPAGGAQKQTTINRLPGFHGKITDVKIVGDSQPGDLSSNAPATPDMDLVAMARWALHALKKNPRPRMNYECRFSMNLLKCPPCPGPNQHDPITAGDTENRLDWEFGYMKEICGDTSADPIAAGVRKRIMGHLRDDGLCWVPTSAFGRLPGLWANHWTTGKLLISLSNDYSRKREETLRPLCRKMFEALRARADWVDGRPYYAGGNSCWNADAWAITDASPYHPAMLLEAVVTYHQTFKDKDALEFAIAFAQGEMANDQWKHWILRDSNKLTDQQKKQIKLTSSIAVWPTAPAEADLSVRPDGSFDHHSHMRGHQGWGMAHLASLTREPELVAWCKRLLDFFLARGTDYGWIPESMTYPRRSETCAVADVIDMAAHLARCGYPAYWDTVERFMRNYIREAQFFITPDYEKLYRSLHPGKQGEKGLAMARDFEGGFQGAMGLSDRCYAGTEMDMMGCCLPEGMRAMHTAWRNTVTDEKAGVHVNMSFNRDAPQASVLSFLPFKGRMTVAAKVSRDFYLRPPAWTPKDRIKVYRNGQLVPTRWQGAYVLLDRVRSGDVLTMTYPLLSFVQKQSIKNAPGQPDRQITVTWLGNTVRKLEPRGDKLPLYQQVPRPLPPPPE